MSILYSFKKFVDPDTARIEEAAARIERERPAADDDGGRPPEHYECRVCGQQSTEPAFCPTCLADTMRPLRPRQP